MHKIIDMQLMTNNLDHITLSVKKKGFLINRLTYSAAQTGQLNILDECKALFSSMFTAWDHMILGLRNVAGGSKTKVERYRPLFKAKRAIHHTCADISPMDHSGNFKSQYWWTTATTKTDKFNEVCNALWKNYTGTLKIFFKVR